MIFPNRRLPDQVVRRKCFERLFPLFLV